jgi:predicted dehydrogenase
MFNAAIVGLGWWGKVLVGAVQGKSDKITFTAGATRTKSKAVEFADEQDFTLLDSYEDVLADPNVNGVVLATPHSQHKDQVIAAAAAGKHVLVEKPFALTKDDVEQAVAAVQAAGVTVAIGHNRRYHPAMIELRKRVRDGDLGTVVHCEATMTSSSGFILPPDQWRVLRSETPAGGMTPMGIHLIDTMIDLFGPIDEVYCQSFHMAVPNDTDDTTSVLLRMKSGMSAYLGTILATGTTFRFQVFGTDGVAQVSDPSMKSFEFSPRDQSSRSGQPSGAEATVLDFSGFDSVHAALEAFADAATGGPPFAVPPEDMIHATAVLEAVIRSAETGKVEKVG